MIKRKSKEIVKADGKLAEVAVDVRTADILPGDTPTAANEYTYTKPKEWLPVIKGVPQLPAPVRIQLGGNPMLRWANHNWKQDRLEAFIRTTCATDYPRSYVMALGFCTVQGGILSIEGLGAVSVKTLTQQLNKAILDQ